MIGLARGTVRVVPPDDEWPVAFAQERRRLCERIGHLVLDIQHVGSTAVPGLAAKPIIDIAVAIASPADVPRCRPLLIALGYIDRGDRGRKGGYVFVKECAPEVRTHHLHMVAIDDPQWADYLRFRDSLRADAALRTEYAALKRRLQERFSGDRQGYTNAKDAFIRRVLAGDAPETNDTHLFVSQLHVAMLKLHNAVVDWLRAGGAGGRGFLRRRGTSPAGTISGWCCPTSCRG